MEVVEILGIGVDVGNGVQIKKITDPVPVLIVKLLVIGCAGIAEVEVHLLKQLLCFREERVHALPGAQVAGKGDHIFAVAGDAVGMTADRKDPVALLLHQLIHDGLADAAGSAGDNDVFVLDHKSYPPVFVLPFIKMRAFLRKSPSRYHRRCGRRRRWYRSVWHRPQTRCA